MKPTAALQATLFQEMLGHIKQTDDTVPYRENGYLYYSRTREGLQYPIYVREARGAERGRRGDPRSETNAGQGHEYTGLGGRSVSDDGNLLAFSVDYLGYRQFTPEDQGSPHG
jgi:oligopeptidase B